MTSGLLPPPRRIVFKMCPNNFSILRQPPFKRLIKLFLCWQVSFLFLFIFTAPFSSPLPGRQHASFASAWRWQPSSKDAQPHPRHTHTHPHTLLHRLVSIINRLARQEACAAAAHREAGKEWEEEEPARGSGFGIFNNHEPRFQLQRWRWRWRWLF